MNRFERSAVGRSPLMLSTRDDGPL